MAPKVQVSWLSKEVVPAPCTGTPTPTPTAPVKFVLPPFPVGRAGSIAGDYQLGRSLGLGGFGLVSRAVSRETGDIVAVKRLRKPRAALKASLLESELSIAAAVRHPHIVRLFEVYDDGADVCMVMQCCSGGELYDAVKAGDVKEEQMRAYAWQMLSAVGYLHCCLIVHRDIKAENFVLQSAARGAPVKLIDFGMSRRYKPGVAMSTIIGTHGYLAPEMLKQSYGELVDIWSLGVVVYASLSGSHPFMRCSDRATLQCIRRGRPEFRRKQWRGVSSQAADFVRHLLAYKVEDRPSAYEAMRHAWLSAPTGEHADVFDKFAERHRAFAVAPWPLQVAMAAAAWHLPEEDTRLLATIFALRSAGAVDCSVRESDGAAAVGDDLAIDHPGGDHSAQLLRALATGAVDFATWLAASVEPGLLARPAVAKAALRTLCPGDGGRIPRAALSLAAGALAPSLVAAYGVEAAGPDVEAEALAAALAAVGEGGATYAGGVALSAATFGDAHGPTPLSPRVAPAEGAVDASDSPRPKASQGSACEVACGGDGCSGDLQRSPPAARVCRLASSISSRSTAESGCSDGCDTPDPCALEE